MRATKRSLSSLLLAALGGGCGSAGPGSDIEGLAVVEIELYDYQFDLETRSASSTLTLNVVDEGNCLRLPMRAMHNGDAYLDGKLATLTQLGENLTEFCVSDGFEAGIDTDLFVELTVPNETWRDSQVGYSQSIDIEGSPFYYAVSWVGGCDRFGPCDNRADAFAEYRFTIDHPSNLQVLCPGEITASDSQTICDFSKEGGPTYSTFGFAASPSWQEVDLGDWNGIDVTLYDFPTADLATQLDIEEHKAYTQWMVETFGPYPYGNELRFAAGPTYWNGFEHPGNIVLNERLDTGGFGSNFSNPLAHTTSHEIAHQWAGDQTTLASTYDFVWKEAMAEYLVYVHKEEEISTSRADRTLRAWETFSRSSEYYLVPGERPELIDYYGDVYGPGPHILFRQLEAIFSREEIMSALGQLLGKERTLSIDELQSALEESVGESLDGYFDQWVYGEGAPAWPEYEVATADEGGMTRVTVTQRDQNKGLWGCAFDLALRGAEEGEETILRVNLGASGMAEWSELVELTYALDTIVFDPKRECLGTRFQPGARPTKRPERVNPWVATP